MQVLQEQRGKHPTHVFSYNGKPLKKYSITFGEKPLIEPVFALFTQVVVTGIMITPLNHLMSINFLMDLGGMT